MAIPDRVLFHPSSSPVLFLYDWDAVLGRLHYFAYKGPDFMILEVESGDYIQCAGVKKRLTVETRRYTAGKEFRHEVWGKGILTGFAEKIDCTDGEIEVDSSQVLAMRDARLLIRAFLEQDEMPALYQGTDVSNRFDPVPDDMTIRNRAWSWPDRRQIRKQKVEQGACTQPSVAKAPSGE